MTVTQQRSLGHAADIGTLGRAAPYDGLLAVGAVAGSAAALAVTELAGIGGVAATATVLVGLDLGVLVGAGLGTWLARRAGPPRPSGRVRERRG